MAYEFNLPFSKIVTDRWTLNFNTGMFAFEDTPERSITAIISPGARYAFNLPNDAQVLIGVALPIGLSPDSPDWGVFLYCSFEHAFLRIRTAPKEITSAISRERIEVVDVT